MADRPFDLTIDPGVAYRIAELTREMDSEDLAPEFDSAEVDTDLGDDPVQDEDQLLAETEDRGVDPIETELTALIDGLNIDAQRDLLALIWLGRGDYGAEDWYQARRQARETANLHVAQYLEETPLASDYLVEGLTLLGYPQEDFGGA